MYSDLYVYHIDLRIWKDLTVPRRGRNPAGRTNHNLIIANGKLFVFGGRSESPSRVSFVFSA